MTLYQIYIFIICFFICNYFLIKTGNEYTNNYRFDTSLNELILVTNNNLLDVQHKKIPALKKEEYCAQNELFIPIETLDLNSVRNNFLKEYTNTVSKIDYIEITYIHKKDQQDHAAIKMVLDTVEKWCLEMGVVSDNIIKNVQYIDNNKHQNIGIKIIFFNFL